jgi:hypothetical protein
MNTFKKRNNPSLGLENANMDCHKANQGIKKVPRRAVRNTTRRKHLGFKRKASEIQIHISSVESAEYGNKSD